VNWVTVSPDSLRGLAATSPRIAVGRSVARASCWAYCALVAFGAQTASADAAGAQPDGKLVTGRLGAGAIVDSRYSGGVARQAFPVPLMSLEIGDFAYVDYWEAGVFFWSNPAKTVGLAAVATPRLGFSSSDGPRLSGMTRRQSTIEAGLALDYGRDDSGVSLSYVHDVTGGSRGGVTRLFGFKHFDFTKRFGLDGYAGVERLDADVARYYYGVGDGEVTAARSAYQPGASTAVSAGVRFNYDFGRRSTLLFGYEPTRLGQDLAKSPIVETRTTSFFYFGYGVRL
jgi:outer membrane protein